MIRGCRTGHSRLLAHRRARCLVAAGILIAAGACKRDRGAGPVVAESIALTASSTSVGIGQTVTLYVHASDAAGTRIPKFSAVTWASSNPTVASVTKADTTATVTGLAVGETVISATVRSGLVAQMAIRVGAIPVILATPSAASFNGYRGSAVNPQSIVISNAGAGALSGLSASTSATWLQATFVDGITTANPTATLRLQPTVGSLNDGTYTGTVTVSSGMTGVASRTIPVTFQVSAGPVAFRIEAVTAPSQSGSAGKPVAQPPGVIVRAADNTPVQGFSVTFASNGGGTIVPTGVITTDANGVAALTSWTLGSQPGASQTVTATAPGLAGSPVTFTATSLAASKITMVSGDGQSAVLGRALTDPLVVRVTDANDMPVPNASVAFTASSGNGAVAPAAATTDANGLAAGTWTLGATLGTQSVTAALVGPPGAPFVTFTATGTGATSLVKVSGDNQQAAAGAELPTALRVRVTGANSLPVVGATVTFQPAGGGTANPATAMTDANGEATTRWTLSASTGAQTLTASVNSATGALSVAFAAVATTPPSRFTGSAAKVPGGAAPTAGDQAVLAYSGPASGEVALSGGSFTTPTLPAGTYTLSVVSKSGAFPTTRVFGVVLTAGQTTSVGTIPIAYAGSGAVRIAVHACAQVGDTNGTATVRLYNGINGDLGGAPVYTWSSIPFGVTNTELGVAYGIYTMTITTQATDPTKNCAVARTQVVHSFQTNDGTTTVPLIVLNNP